MKFSALQLPGLLLNFLKADILNPFYVLLFLFFFISLNTLIPQTLNLESSSS